VGVIGQDVNLQLAAQAMDAGYAANDQKAELRSTPLRP
jgi:hypothetical protein